MGMKASGTPSATAPIYGTGGLFGRCDGPAQLVNAMVGPIGIETVLNYYGTDTEREFVDTLTAIREHGSEQSTKCGDCVTVYNKACAQMYCFGRFCRQTEEHAFDDLGLRANQNVPIKTAFGAITDAAGNVLLGNGEQIQNAFFLQVRSAGYALRYRNSVLIWSGNPQNNTVATQEFQGLQLIVNTGKFDAYTGALCTAVDSRLVNFNNNSPQSAGTYAIENQMRQMITYFMRRAGGANFDWATADHRIVMRDNIWDCVARAYSCSGLDLCAGVSTSRIVQQSADEARGRYEDYLSGMFLPIAGRNYPVILDSQIPQLTGQPGGVVSDIYFLTFNVNGEEVLYGEYQDFNKTYGPVRANLMSMFNSDNIYLTDNGRYAVIVDKQRGCFDVQLLVKPRLVAKMPWLLGRIQNVACDIGTPYPDPTLSESLYSVGCGRTTTPIDFLYGPCEDLQ